MKSARALLATLGACAVVLFSAGTASAATNDAAALRSALSADLTVYLHSRRTAEHISAASLSVSLPHGGPIVDVVAGTTTYGGRTPITPRSLFQIGSNTKAFTAAALLQLEAEHRLSIADTVGRWLPQYPAFRAVTIHQLLDMTSGIVSYDNVPAMLRAYAANPMRSFTTAELVAYADPNGPPVTSGTAWSYTNTAYILAEMIVERASGHGYSDELRRRFLNARTGLTDVHYRPDRYPPAILQRLVSGYFFSTDPGNRPLRPLYGKDVKTYSLSWTQGAGGMIATPHAVTLWVRQLYGALLPQRQQRELRTLVSNATGKPIAATSASDPRGFGLGVGQLDDPVIGTVWFYQGETLGYRVIYGYVPATDVVFAVGLNSQPNEKENHVGQLLQSIYRTLQRTGHVARR